jgi:S1-C subfamily serine protease
MKKYLLSLVILLAACTSSFGQATKPVEQKLPKDVPVYLQDVSVTIHAAGAQGSGVIVTRKDVNYVWTAGHVVDGLRKSRLIIDPKSGATKTLIEFDDARVVKELVENGRRVGEVSMEAEVIRYSNADTGEDLALLRVRKRSYEKASAVFYLESQIPKIGSPLLHCGSLRGQFGSNSMTSGIVSQIGRVYMNTVYDQTTCTAFPGSSGGGVYLNDGRYVGMLVRGAGEGFNLIVPARRMHAWAKKVGVEFAMDESLPVPSEDELKKGQLEDGR